MPGRPIPARAPTPPVPALAALLLAGALSACGGVRGDPLLALSCPAPTGPVTPSQAYDRLDVAALEGLVKDNGVGPGDGPGGRVVARVLGERYRAGRGVPADPAKALAWTRAAAVVETSTTQFIVAPAVGKQPSYTVPLNRTVLTGGDPVALLELGTLYAQGRGVPRDEAVAKVLLECGRKGTQPWM
ncbi:tetratricopeptide repeat protein [Nitrospirillum pindoramense]|uniref:Sel1 repeat-containing protein n=1 Tax=Nitrospirillum amazonense TaxID=28077 RepID=A0A560GYW3_9PROT|nr:SEL1-like repeat protein [Nitrospirillum amazonense]TWB39215.1 Sel1 repeat-containing protein [Nitrospirillum amazonense]